jgi:hypothetical protein
MAELDIVIKAQNQTGGVLGGLKNELSGLDGMAQGVGKSFGGLQNVIGGAFKVAAVGAGVGIAALGAGLVKAVAAGSDVEEMMGKFNVVFANTGAMVTEQLDDFAGAVGRNKFELREMAATFGDTLKPMGFTEDAAAGLAVDLSKLATDLGSFNNMPMDEALRRLQGTLIGSHENALAFGVVINENTLKAEMLTQGWSDLTGAELEAAKVQARINLLMKGTTDAQGDAARTSGSWANVMRRLQSTLQETAAEIGTKLLPVITPLLSRLADMASVYGPQVIDVFKQFLDGVVFVTQAIIDWDTANLPLLGTLQTIYEQVSNVIGPIAEAISSFVGWEDVLIALGIVIASVVLPFLWGLVVAAAPIVAVAAALIGAVALVRTAWENDWGGIRDLVGGVVDSVLGAYQGFMDGTLTLPQAIGSAFAGIGAAISEQLPGWIETLQGWGTAAWQWILDAVPVVLEKLGEWWESIRKYILENRVIWGIELKAWGTAAWQWIVDAIPPMLEKLGDFVGGILGWLADKLPDFIAMIYKWATALVTWIGESIPKAIDNLTKFISGVGQEGDQTGGSVFGEMVGKWIGLLIDWVINDLIPKVGPAFLQFAWALLLALGNIVISLGALASTLGSAIIDGIVSGINAGASAIWDALMRAVTAAWNGAKEFLGIRSPSTLFADMGKQTMAGMAKGITDNIALPASAALSAMGSMTNNSRLQPAYATGGRSGDNYNIYQQVYGAQPADVSRAAQSGVLEANRRRGR